MKTIILCAFLLTSAMAFAAGGTCPSGSAYTEPVTGNTTESLSTMGITSCYFIDFVGGADTNAGTSEGAAWKHAPGMQGCANNCSGASLTTGEGFIFKGGVTWDSTTAQWNWSQSGSNGHPMYLGYDPTWFTGGSWTRPIMSCSGSCQAQMAISATFTNLDNIEFTGIFSNQSSGTVANLYAINITATGNRDVHIYNSYFHGANVAHDGAHVSTFVSWPTAGDDNTSTFHHNVIDNSDVCIIPGGYTGGAGFTCTMSGLQGGPRQIFMNWFSNMSNGVVVDNPTDFHNNHIEWIVLSPDNGTDHENMFESNGESGAGMVNYNNVLQHGYNVGLVDFQMGPNTGITSYAFNNVLPDMDGGNMEQTYEGLGVATGTAYWFNNTAEAGPDSTTPGGTCGRSTNTNMTSNIINQHCITTATGTSWWSGTTGNNFTTNLPQSKATANGQGYTLGSTYSFQPTSISGSTVGAGTNEHALCTTISGVNAAAGTACNSDTSYGVTYNTSTHSITGVGRSSTVARPTATAWDIGAFEFGASFTISPTTIPANHGAGITLTLTGTGTSWNGSTAFSVSGVSGLTLVSCSNISATSETCSVTTGAGTGTATLTDTTDSLSATFQVAQAAAPTCDHITGSYVGSFSNKCSTVTTGTVILCWSTSTTPVSNGDGATCATGTPLANNGSTTISSSQTFNIIAGANGAQDSSVTTYVYTITTPTAGMNLSNGAVMQNGAVIK